LSRALIVAALFLLGAGVRALRFGAPFATPWHWDEVATGIQALLVLRGSFPVHFLNLETTGGLAAYPLAVWFAVVEPSPAAHDVFAYLAGLLMLSSGYLVAQRLLPPRAALLSLAVLAVPALPLAARSVEGTFTYQPLLILGNLSVVATDALFFRGAPRARLVLMLGVLAGLGWWITPLMLVFMTPFVALTLRTGLVRRACALLYPLGFVLGSLPVWLYESQHFPSGLWSSGEGLFAVSQPFLLRAADLLRTDWPIILGADVRAWPLPGQGVIIGGLVTLGTVAVVWAGIRDHRAVAWTIGATRGRPPNGLVILWVVAATNVVLVLASPHGTGEGRYLLPLYAVLPCWIGEMLSRIWDRRGSLGGMVLAIYLAIQLGLNWTASFGGTPHEQRRWRPLEQLVTPLVRALDEAGVRGTYLTGGLMPREVPYHSGLRVITVHPWGEQIPPLAWEVDAESAPPFAVPSSDRSRLDALRAGLRGLGLVVGERPAGPFTLVTAREDDPTGFRSLATDGWEVTANPRNPAARLLIDRDASTGWNTGEPQAPGQQVTLDLGQERLVSRVDLLAIDWQEVPAAFRVEVRDVPAYWGPLFFSEHHAFLRVRRGRVQAVFPPVRSRFVRIVQTGTSPHEWAGRELFVYGPGLPRPSLPPEGALAAALRREGVRFVYASPWLSARIRAESRGAIGALESNLYVDPNGLRDPPPERLEHFRPNRGRALVIGSDTDADTLRATLRAYGVEWREAHAGPYPVLVFVRRRPAPRPLVPDGWTAQATANAAEAFRAVDGRRQTRWSAGRRPDADARFTVDLARPRRIQGIRVVPGSNAGGPTAYIVEGSLDGSTWRRLEPETWAGPLFWSGSELLRNGGEEWAVTFPATEVRYVRLRPDGISGGPWVIDEIECLGP
jgi:F5/8 type C domain